MESLSPTHPNLENVTISTQETKPATSAPAPESPISHPISSSNPAARTTFPTMHPVASPSLHSQPSTTSPVLHYYQPYTPSQEEIQSHPIVQQRLSVPRDEVTTGFGTAIAPPASVEVFEECWSSAADPRLAHITRAPVAMAETQVKEGDQGMYALVLCDLATSVRASGCFCALVLPFPLRLDASGHPHPELLKLSHHLWKYLPDREQLDC